jgi:FG-GAP repeat
MRTIIKWNVSAKYYFNKMPSLKKILPAFLFLLFLCSRVAFSQNVGIGTNTPHASAQLEISSSNKGTLITTMTSTQRNAISNPATGLLVYDINKKTIYMFNGTNWIPLLYSNTDQNPAQPINASNGAPGDEFGCAVAIDDDYAIVGAQNKRIAYPGNIFKDQGAAYIYFRNNGVWEIQDAIYASDGETGDYFGASVSISGDYAVIGAWGDDVEADANQGSIYIFVRSGTTWTQHAKFTAADGLENDFFGYSVSMSDSTIVAGAYGDNIGANINQGSAYVYSRNGVNWTYSAKLTASDGAFDDSFGASVSISGPYIVVGAYLDDVGVNTDQGSVYSFYELTNANGWTSGQAYHQKLTASDGAAEDYYGISVSVSVFGLVVGASGDDVSANFSQGSAYTYFRSPIGGNLWGSQAKITAPDGAANDNFGISVSKTTSFAVVGAYRADAIDGVLNAGKVYVFNSSGAFPSFRRKIEDDTGTNDGYFGSSIAVSGFELIIGAYGKNNSRGQISVKNIQ